jgi:hypothetical protein
VEEIDLPEGYISIDCEIEFGVENGIKFFLNQSSVDKDIYLLGSSSEFKYQLLNFIGLELLTERMDIENLLNEIMIEEFGANADILNRDVDSD